MRYPQGEPHGMGSFEEDQESDEDQYRPRGGCGDTVLWSLLGLLILAAFIVLIIAAFGGGIHF